MWIYIHIFSRQSGYYQFSHVLYASTLLLSMREVPLTSTGLLIVKTRLTRLKAIEMIDSVRPDNGSSVSSDSSEEHRLLLTHKRHGCQTRRSPTCGPVLLVKSKCCLAISHTISLLLAHIVFALLSLAGVLARCCDTLGYDVSADAGRTCRFTHKGREQVGRVTTPNSYYVEASGTVQPPMYIQFM